jgi:hypothetical protein
MKITHGMVEEATNELLNVLFQSSELPVSSDEWDKYYNATAIAIEAAIRYDILHIRGEK